ncbi:MAG: asparagine synthase (glutamine-hydrolyzing) [Lachnospiraceae bacterium]|nr:asparagine synthase (glutamine-hydrolyzing) [Lachnospiraceae bacterium]
MCGICGIYNIQNTNRIESPIIDQMLEKIKHRGPDGQNRFVQDNVALGFNRLSFIDLSGGMQPFQNEDGSITSICNGEIFNYQELKEELLLKGHAFRSGTDTEVVVHLYEEYGLDFPKLLNGQFAVAIYDSRKEELILVRDYVGISPLFYSHFDGRMIFASEVKAILEYPDMTRKLNMKAVDQLMNYPGGAISPQTFFKDIYSLRPGHMLVCSPEKVEDIEYWDIIYPVESEDLGEEYYVETLRELLKKAISRRLIADVPIGFYISGGLDSSLVACFVGKYLLDSHYSFSAEIGDGDLDESRFQQIIKDCVNSTHYHVRITEKELWENLPSVIYHAESAVKESYDVAAYLLSGLVSGSPAKAVLTGQGSDEFFCGYIGYTVDQFRKMQRGQMTKEECEVNERLWGDPYFRFEREHLKIREIHRTIYSERMRSSMEEFSAIAESPVNVKRLEGLSDAKRRSYIDAKLRLADHLLGEHGDRMIFSHSVEGRHPFLDKELLEFVFRMPDKYKLNGANEKYILKKAGEGIVPDEILKRRKFPFQAPGMSSMIKKVRKNDFLSDELIRKYDIFDMEKIHEMKELYLQDDFKLMGAYEIDYLLIALTVSMLCETYHLTV